MPYLWGEARRAGGRDTPDLREARLHPGTTKGARARHHGVAGDGDAALGQAGETEEAEEAEEAQKAQARLTRCYGTRQVLKAPRFGSQRASRILDGYPEVTPGTKVQI